MKAIMRFLHSTQTTWNGQSASSQLARTLTALSSSRLPKALPSTWAATRWLLTWLRICMIPWESRYRLLCISTTAHMKAQRPASKPDSHLLCSTAPTMTSKRTLKSPRKSSLSLTAKGVSVECEVGGIGGTEDGVTSNGELADPKECADIAALGVDFLAAGIGNIHGKYPANWAGLNFDRLNEINEAVNGKPLVLHGGSGIPFEQTSKAITMGVSKINVNTELQLVFADATRKYIEAGKDLEGKGYDPRKLLKPGADAIIAKAIELCEAFGSANKA